MKKNKIKLIICIIIVVLLAGGIGYKLGQRKENNIIDTSLNDIIQQDGDTIKPKEIQSIDISMENEIYSLAIIDNFEDGKKLSTDQYLSVVYNGIVNGYISLPNVLESKEISEVQVNSIVYKIFGVELNENKSIIGMEYTNGKYKIDTKRSGYIFLMQDKSTDSAAGTAYSKFDLYKEFSSGKEEYIGKYEISIVHNTVTGESYIKSFNKVQ